MARAFYFVSHINLVEFHGIAMDIPFTFNHTSDHFICALPRTSHLTAGLLV
ncbi:Olfactory receptor 2T10 [Gossypium arboreum]|uniref:Olfactory receptor 2T10 n=1 Tax=Gossypium arboreum TaxID=29729 RepID=A0A0B0NFC4_GOSAR|nr:Olfactory receptor 2T10 [Gossypium arboreum]